MGDNIRRVPITGNDTVMDALSSVNGLSQVSSTTIWVAATGAGRFRLRADPAGRLRGDHQGGLVGDELPDHAGRSGVCGERRHDCGEHLVGEDDGSDRAAAGDRLVGHLQRP